MNDQNVKNLFLRVFYPSKTLKMREKILWNPEKLFFVLYKEKIKSQLKVEIGDGCELYEVPLKPM